MRTLPKHIAEVIRRRHQEPLPVEKARSLRCLGEIEGFRDQTDKMGLMTPEIDNALRIRQRELMEKKE